MPLNKKHYYSKHQNIFTDDELRKKMYNSLFSKKRKSNIKINKQIILKNYSS